LVAKFTEDVSRKNKELEECERRLKRLDVLLRDKRGELEKRQKSSQNANSDGEDEGEEIDEESGVKPFRNKINSKSKTHSFLSQAPHS